MNARILRMLPPAGRRRSMYLAGICFSGLGLALILSVFVTLAAHFTDMQAIRVRGGSMALRAVTGLVLSGMGFGGMAAATHVDLRPEHRPVEDENDEPRRSELDRELLRRDGENDQRLFDDPRPKLALLRLPTLRGRTGAIDRSIPIDSGQLASNAASQNSQVVVKIRCRSCRNLSAEEASYCEHCGHRL